MLRCSCTGFDSDYLHAEVWLGFLDIFVFKEGIRLIRAICSFKLLFEAPVTHLDLRS